jgi:hypothetical protein
MSSALQNFMFSCPPAKDMQNLYKMAAKFMRVSEYPRIPFERSAGLPTQTTNQQAGILAYRKFIVEEFGFSLFGAVKLVSSKIPKNPKWFLAVGKIVRR